MKCFATVAAILSLSAPGYAGERAVEKAPYYRPPSSQRIAPGSAPRQTSGTVIVNAASYEAGISPGGLATIFGNDLSTVSGIVLAYRDPLPLELAGVEVWVSGLPAPIYGVAYANGLDQISIQVPYDAPTGPFAAEIQVYDFGELVADFFSDSFTQDPGIFVYNGNFAVAQAADYSIIGPDNPAIPGEPLVLYVTGLGRLDLDLVDGYGSPTSPPFARTIDPFQVIVDNEICDVFFSGLAPGFVGLYQINFYVPFDARRGDLPIWIRSPRADSLTATLPIR